MNVPTFKKSATLLVPDSRPGSPSAGDNQVILDPEIVTTKAELQFYYAFYFPLVDGKSVPKLSSSNQVKIKEINVELSSGNDGHLLFAKPSVSVEIEQVPSFQDLRGGPADQGNQKAARTLSRNAGMTFPQLMSINETDVKLSQVIMRLYDYGIGVLRFSVELPPLTPLQTILDCQNGTMRMGKYAKRMIFKNSSNVEFQPAVFVESVVSLLMGTKDEKWFSDFMTDRLSVYSLAAFDNIVGMDNFNFILYKIAKMEDYANSPGDKAFLDDFYRTTVYTRRITSNGGIWTSFHIDGGATLFFTQNGFPEVPVRPDERAKKISCFGSSKPLIPLSIFEPYLVQRMYLRRMDQTVLKLISKGTQNKDAVQTLKDVHLENLKYKVFMFSKPVSSSSGGNEQFTMHVKIAQLDSFYASLNETILSLYAYYDSVEEKASQGRLDALSLIFGVLGVAGLILSFYQYYIALDSDNPRYWVHAFVPTVMDGILMILAIQIIQKMRSNE